MTEVKSHSWTSTSDMKEMYAYVILQAKMLLKAGDTDNVKQKQINGFVWNRLCIEYSEAFGEGVVIDNSMVDVRMDYEKKEIVCQNLYTYVLMHGIYVAPWDWIYDKKYYSKVLDVDFYYKMSTKQYELMKVSQ